MRMAVGVGSAALLTFGAIWYYVAIPDSTPVPREAVPPPVALISDVPNESVDLAFLVAEATENLDPTYRAIEPPEFEVIFLDPIHPVADTWNETYAVLINRAENGDSDAQYHLARTAQVCFHGPTTVAEFDEWQSTVTADHYDGMGNFVSSTSSRHDNIRQEGLSILEFCRDSSPQNLVRFPEWLEMAADSGNLRAMVNYAAEYPGDDDLDPDKNAEDRRLIKERTSKYTDYLEKSTELGSIDAMWRLAYRRLDSDFEKNRKEAFAYLYSYAWYRLRFEGSDASFKAINRLSEQMSPLQYQEAVDEGKRLLNSNNCCIKIPENL